MRSGSHWWWMRPASTASCAFMPKSTTLRMVSSTVLMMVRPPGEPVTMNSLPSRARIDGDMLDSIRLPGRARLGLRADVAALVGHLGRRVEVAHLVVEQEAGAGHDDARAVAVLERVGHRHGVALRVDHRQVGRLLRLGRPGERRRRRHRGLVRVDGLAHLGGVVLRDELRHRDALLKSGSPRCWARSANARRIDSATRCRFCAEP